MIIAEYEEINDGEGELDLSSTDSLPWLESDEDYEGAGGYDLRQILGFAGLLIVFLALLVALVWFVSNQVSTNAVEADGSVIAAPEGPIKDKPTDPGGKEFAGTGNVAPMVGEGGTPQAVVASKDRPQPVKIDADNVENKPPAPAATSDSAASASTSGVGVQLAAYSTRERAEQGWADLSRRSQALQGVRHRVVEGKVDIGTVYRLQAVAADRAGADQLCAALKREGLDCQVKP
jgi:hypothetical protein